MNQERTTSTDSIDRGDHRIATADTVGPTLPLIIETLCEGSPLDTVRSPSAIPPAIVLEPGLHCATLEALLGDLLIARLLDGRRTSAMVLPHVAPALVDQCLAENRLVLLTQTTAGPQMAGALQTTPSIAHDREGNLTIHARRLRVHADEQIRVETGTNAVVSETNADGTVRTRCEHGTLDFAANLRVHSALVELP